MSYAGPERRRHPRIKANFIVSYRVLEGRDDIDTSQAKDFSAGGVYITTNRPFGKGVRLALRIRLPFGPEPVEVAGTAVDSREIVKDLIYDTRVEFSRLKDEQRKVIEQTVSYYLKKKEKS